MYIIMHLKILNIHLQIVIMKWMIQWILVILRMRVTRIHL